VSFSFHPAGRLELDQAADYYEACQPGLGRRFAEDVFAAIARIVKYPEAWPLLSRRARRCLTTRFPYGVIYLAKDAHVYVIAVAHSHRRPGYWQSRLAGEGERPGAPDRKTV